MACLLNLFKFKRKSYNSNYINRAVNFISNIFLIKKSEFKFIKYCSKYNIYYYNIKNKYGVVFIDSGCRIFINFYEDLKYTTLIQILSIYFNDKMIGFDKNSFDNIFMNMVIFRVRNNKRYNNQKNTFIENKYYKQKNIYKIKCIYKKSAYYKFYVFTNKSLNKIYIKKYTRLLYTKEFTLNNFFLKFL
jgi:hypothetical protein